MSVGSCNFDDRFYVCLIKSYLFMAKYILPCYIIFSNPCARDQLHQIHVSVPATTGTWHVRFLTLTLCFIICIYHETQNFLHLVKI